MSIESIEAEHQELIANTDAEYYRVETAAPFASIAKYLNHPAHGWLPVLDAYTSIETDAVIVVLGDGDTGAFLTTYETHYSNTEDLIVDKSGLLEVGPEEGTEIADDIATTESLPTSTPGMSNLN